MLCSSLANNQQHWHCFGKVYVIIALHIRFHTKHWNCLQFSSILVVLNILVLIVWLMMLPTQWAFCGNLTALKLSQNWQFINLQLTVDSWYENEYLLREFIDFNGMDWHRNIIFLVSHVSGNFEVEKSAEIIRTWVSGPSISPKVLQGFILIIENTIDIAEFSVYLLMKIF